MDTKGLLDLILRSGKELASEGKGKLDSVSEKAGLDKLDGGTMKGAAAGAGLAALLLGTGAGRGLLKMGSLAALGTLAYRSYQNYQKGDTAQADAPAAQPADAPTSSDDSLSPEAVLAAMIAAAHADGRIDEDEQRRIDQFLETIGELDSDLLHFVKAEIANPRSASALASMAQTDTQRSELYLAALLAIKVDTIAEMQWLEDLARALNLDPGLKRALEDEASKAE